jgi:integrase
VAGLYKPSYRDKRTGKSKKTAKWYGWFRAADGTKHRVPLCRDKAAATKMLADAIARADREQAGLIDPFEEHRSRPLAEHLAAWERAVLAAARPTPRGQKQARMTAGRARRVLEACGFKSIREISPSHVHEYIASLRTDAPPCGGRKRRYSCSLQTLNYYVRSCKQFCRWLVRDRRAGDNPLAHLRGWNAKLDRRHDRRDLSLDELARLLEAARQSGCDFRGLTGPDRQMLYATAVGTGLRASELSSLYRANFLLDRSPPVVLVLAGYTKNQTSVEQVLPADLTEALRAYLARRPADEPVWPGTWVERASRMIRNDLQAARSAWLAETADTAEQARREASSFLAYRSEDGTRYGDFHALRHTFITLLARSGVSPRLAQSLARHSDINLTMSRYTHVALHDQAAALDALPAIVARQQNTGDDSEKAAG